MYTRLTLNARPEDIISALVSEPLPFGRAMKESVKVYFGIIIIDIYPNPVDGITLRATLLKSPVFVKTVLPHQVKMLLSPIVPFFGNSRQKNTRTIPTATPESSAAERTSIEIYSRFLWL